MIPGIPGRDRERGTVEVHIHLGRMVAKHNRLTELSREQHQRIISYKKKNFQRPLYNAFMRRQSVESSE